MRKFSWFIIAVNVLFVAMLVSGLSNTGGICDGETGSSLEACQAGAAIGGTMAVGALLFFWVAVDVILGIVWLVTGKSGRDCPACGRGVKKGRTSCGKCGHSFVAAPAVPPAPAV